MKRFFSFITNAAMAVKAIIFFILLGAVIYVLYLLYNMFGITDAKTQTFAMNEWQLLKAQELVVAKINGNVTGRYGYRKVIHTTLFGERHDTLDWWVAGSKYIDIDGPVTVTIGYDMQKGDKLFSENATGEMVQTKDSIILRVVTDYPVPNMIGSSIRNIPNVSNSLFTGGISDAEFFAYADSSMGMTAQSIIHEEQQFFMSAYSEAVIGVLNQSVTVVANGKNVRIDLVVNGTPYVPKNRQTKKLDDINFDVGVTKVL